MGGIDKGLQTFQGKPLALHALERLQPQVASCVINANRHIDVYQSWGVDVISDAAEGDQVAYEGPLEGFAAGLQHCHTPWMLTVACDSPCFPSDLAMRMLGTAEQSGKLIVMAAGPEMEESAEHLGAIRSQPTFCLIHQSLRKSLNDFVQAGGRKIDRWTSQHEAVLETFDKPHDDPWAFANANTLAQLQQLERLQRP